jgi:nucleoside 2-deoxyribosyltransferase
VNSPRPSLYVAGPLFSDAERSFNDLLKVELSPFFDVFLPQCDGELFVDLVASGMTSTLARAQIFQVDLGAIEAADVILIVLDGRSVDEGAAFELGFAFALRKLCVGLQTDPRRLLCSANNPMIDKALDEHFVSVEQLINWARKITYRETSVTPHLGGR